MDKIFDLAHVKQRIDLLQTSNSVYKLCASVDVKEDAISEQPRRGQVAGPHFKVVLMYDLLF